MDKVVINFGRDDNQELLVVVLVELEALWANGHDVRLVRVKIIDFLVNQVQDGPLVLTVL